MAEGRGENDVSGYAAFRKLTATETSHLLSTVHSRRATVLFKFPDSGVFRVKAAVKGWGQSILAPRPATLADSRRDQVITGNFQLDRQMYFFSAKVRIQKKQLHLQLTGELQKLIRRKQERYEVPDGVPLHLVTKRAGDKLVFLRGILQDLSMKGCKVSFLTYQPEIKAGEVLNCLLRFGNRKPIAVTGTVRHMRRLDKGRYDQTCGIEFSKVEDLLRLQAWLVDLQRESFARM